MRRTLVLDKRSTLHAPLLLTSYPCPPAACLPVFNRHMEEARDHVGLDVPNRRLPPVICVDVATPTPITARTQTVKLATQIAGRAAGDGLLMYYVRLRSGKNDRDAHPAEPVLNKPCYSPPVKRRKDLALLSIGPIKPDDRRCSTETRRRHVDGPVRKPIERFGVPDQEKRCTSTLSPLYRFGGLWRDARWDLGRCCSPL